MKFQPVIALLSRIRADELDVVAAWLAYTTLLSLVPLVALVIVIATYVPGFAEVHTAFDQLLVKYLLPEKAGKLIASYTLTFSGNATRYTVVGIGFLLVVVWAMFWAIEQAYNRVWRLTPDRRFFHRVAHYLLLLCIVPIVLGMGFAGLMWAVSLSLGFFGEPLWVQRVASGAVATLTLAAFLAWLNWVMPNCHVRIKHALYGGLFSAVGIALLQWGFGQYLQKFSSYTAIYGAFSILPVFLLWLYLCWLMVLLGCVVTAELADSPGRQLATARYLS
ncbi:MAG: YhjD/YihY/BrkB family envelope integrity protein [Fluviibacter sp.]